MVSVSICHGETIVTLECDGGYSPDVVDDLSTQAAAAAVAAAKAVVA